METKKQAVSTKKNYRKALKNIPALPFEEAIQLAETIWKCGTGPKVRRITLFDHMDKSPEGNFSRAMVTASSKYKLTTGSNGAEYIELTEIGGIASNPESSKTEAARARFQLAIMSNKFFEKLYKAFSGKKLPENKVMVKYVISQGIPEEEAVPCVETFIVNAKYIGLIQMLSSAQRLIKIEHLIEEIEREDSEPFRKTDSLYHTKNILENPPDEAVSYNDICFYISPIGSENSDERRHSDMILECLISPVLEEFGLKAIRADQIDKPGIITNQILEYIIKSKIVIADLSFHNPNVFYELGVRHMKKLPTIHLIRSKDKIPFDIGNFRTIILDMTDIYTFVPQLETYRFQISSQLRSLMNIKEEADNPVSVYLNR